MDTCDTIDIYGSFFYVSCGYWLPNAGDGSLPLVAKFNLATMAYTYSYYMGFDLAQTPPIPPYYDRQIIPYSQVVGGNMYFYGISKLLFGTTPTNRFPYVNMFDLTLFKFGSHVAITQ